MMPKTCRNCGEQKRCSDTFVSWIFFLIGLIATLAVRVVTVLDAYRPLYGKIAWYLGVAGFFIFFIYKFRVDSSRARMIRDSRIAEKAHKREPLNEDDYTFVSSVLCALSSNKDRINYFFIFATSILAIAAAIYIDVFR